MNGLLLYLIYIWWPLQAVTVTTTITKNRNGVCNIHKSRSMERSTHADYWDTGKKIEVNDSHQLLFVIIFYLSLTMLIFLFLLLIDT